jgi:hypothetical protein
MLTGNESYIIMKLTTGEQLMCVLEQEDATHMQILDPMIIKTIPIINESKEHITAHPYCQFTDDNVFDIDKKNIIFVKRMKEIMIPHYQRIVMQHSAEGEVQEAERITAEEARKRIKMLANIFGEELEEVLGEEKAELEGWFIEGNDTKH